MDLEAVKSDGVDATCVNQRRIPDLPSAASSEPH